LDNLSGTGTQVVEWDIARGEVYATLRDIIDSGPVWSRQAAAADPDCQVRESGGAVGARYAWLTWQCRFAPIPVVAIDLESGAEVARREFEGYAIRLYPEPDGDRLLAWIHDTDHQGRMLVLDSASLSVVDTLGVPHRWFPRSFRSSRDWDSADGVTVVPLTGCGLPPDEPAPEHDPMSLVVTWDDSVSVHFLPLAACLDSRGDVRIWYEWFSDVAWRHIEILKWTPPMDAYARRRWADRWERLPRER